MSIIGRYSDAPMRTGQELHQLQDLAESIRGLNLPTELMAEDDMGSVSEAIGVDFDGMSDDQRRNIAEAARQIAEAHYARESSAEVLTEEPLYDVAVEDEWKAVAWKDTNPDSISRKDRSEISL